MARRRGADAVARGLDRLRVVEDRAIEDPVAVAKLGRPWGVHGDIAVRVHNPDSDLAWTADHVALRGPGFPLAVVEGVTWSDKGHVLVARFEGIDSPEDAAALTHLEVLVPRAAIPAPESDDEFLVHDLLGVEVVDDVQGSLGRITAVFPTGANDVWVVRDDAGRETLIPAVHTVVLSVDIAARRAVVHYELI